MKKFFKFGKKKKGGDGDTASVASGSKAHSRSGSIASETGIYVVRDKDLPKLHKAAWTGDLNKVKQLAKKNVNELDKSNRTALHFACSKGNPAIVRELLEWKSKPNIGDNQQRTPLIKAVQSGSKECISLLLEERADVNTADLDGNSALHHAVESCDVDVLGTLLDCGRINIDVQNKEGQTPLHYAVQLKRQDVTRTLIQNGADVDVKDNEGRTPLMVCCNDGSADLARILLQNGADAKIKNSAGWTADDIAIMANHDNCREVIGQFSSSRQRPPAGRAAAAGDGGVYGLPAGDEGDMSDAENTMSKASDGAGIDSWADSEEDSEHVAANKKKQGSPHKSKPPAYDDIAEEAADLPRPPVGFGGSRVDLADSDSSSSSDSDPEQEAVPKLNLVSMMADKKTNAAVASNEQGTNKPPLTSARSNASAHSALSLGGDDPSTWSDNDDSLFSSARDKPKKPNLAQLIGQAKNKSVPEEDDKTEDDGWSDEDVSLPLSGATPRPKTAATPKPAMTTFKPQPVKKQSVVETDESEGEENKKNEIAEKTKSFHGVAKDKAKQLMAELGLSDISDVSDPNMSDDENPLTKFKQAVGKKRAANKHSDDESEWDSTQAEDPVRKTSGGKPQIGSAKTKPDESDWDTTEAPTPRSAKGTTKVPLSARSAMSDWDSTIDEGDEPVAAAPKASFIPEPFGEVDDQLEDLLTPPVEFKGRVFAQKARNKVDDIPPPLPKSAPPPLPTKPPPIGRKPSTDEDRNEMNLAEELHQSGHFTNHLSPRSVNSTPRPLVGSTPRETEGAPSGQEKTMYQEDDVESDWDSDVSPPLSPTGAAPVAAATPTRVAQSPSHPAAPQKSAPMYGGVETDSEDEESESEWEKENKEKKLSESTRQKKWEEEFERQQEKLRIEAAEELKKEQEEQERQRREAEEEERLEIERQKEKERKEREKREQQQMERLENERREQEKKVEEERERREQEQREREEKEKREIEERERTKREEIQRREKEEEDRLRKLESEAKEQKDKLLSPKRDDVDALGDFSEDEADIAGHEVLDRPELAVSLNKPPVAPKPVLKQRSLSTDFDDDSINDDLDRMPGVGKMNGHHHYHHQHQPQDDDCLSYSSTEHDVSIHDGQHNGSTTPLNTSVPLNMSFNNDVLSSPRHQEQLRDSRRQLDRERSMRASLENRRKNLEKEKSDMLQKLEDITRAKSSLEQIKIDSDAKLRTLQYNLNEETEKRKNAEMLYNKTKEQLSRKDEQYTQEVEAKQNTELAMRNMQMELRTALANIKQYEEEKDDLSRQLTHEKNARILQEQINEEQVKLQDVLNGKEDTSLLGTQKLRQDLAEAYTKLESADENRKQAMDSVEKLKAELYATKMEFERQKNRFKDDHGLLSSENEELQTKIEELKSDIKLNEDALAHATMQYNIQLSQLKTENTVLISNLEKEKNSREKVEAELNSVKTRLEGTMSELNKAQAARSELERNNHKTNEDWGRSIERKDQEINALKESKHNQSHKLSATESRIHTLENELHIANATLAERTNQLQTIQRDLDQRRLTQENLDESFRKEKEDNVRMEAKMESLQDRLSSLQRENLKLQQQLDEAKLLGSKTDAAGDKLSATLLAQIKSDQDKARTSQEERNSSLNENLVRVREELRSIEGRKSSLEQELRHAQTELADMGKKCSVAEASLEVANKAKEQLEAERNRLLSEIEKLQSKLEAAQEKYMESNVKASQLADRVERADYSTQLTSQQLQNQAGNVESLARTKAELDEAVHRLELEKAKLEAALDHEQQKTNMLQQDLNKSERAHQALSERVYSLSSENTGLKYETNEAIAAKTQATNEAEDSRGLWESEVKARSKLGMRIAQLDRQRQEAEAKVEEEKKKVRKALELKKLGDAKFEAEVQKNTQMREEIATLKSHLKSTKRRLKLDDVNGQLQMEMGNKNDMERETRKLQMELNSLRSMEKTYSKLERAKRKVQEEFDAYKDHVNSNYVEKASLERLQGDLETRTRMELNQKLEEVNTYLEEQSKAREKIDQMRDDNDNMMRKEFEKTKKELMDELGKMRDMSKDAMDEKNSKDFELQKFKDLYEAELKLRNKLGKRLEKATDTAAKAQHYMDRQRLGGSLPLQGAWSPQATSTLLTKPTLGHGVNDLSFSMKAELERSIAKHLEKTPHIDISLPPRSLTEDSSLRPSFEKSSSEYLSVLKKNYML